MIRQLIILICVCVAIPYGQAQENGAAPLFFDGVWVPVALEIGGEDLPPTTFENQRLILQGNSYIFEADSVDKGTVVYQEDGKIDIYGKDGVNAGKHFTAIYKLEEGLLTICYNLAGDPYPSAFETASQPTLFLAVFKKAAE